MKKSLENLATFDPMLDDLHLEGHSRNPQIFCVTREELEIAINATRIVYRNEKIWYNYF